MTTTTTKPEISIRCTALRAVMPFAATADVRRYLNAVMLRPAGTSGGVVAVASNGHCLAVAHDTAGTWFGERRSVLIPRVSTRADWSESTLRYAAAANAGASTARIQVGPYGHSAEIKVGTLETAGSLLDETPPDYLRAIDCIQSAAPMAVDAGYLAMAAKAFKVIGERSAILQTGGLTGALRAYGDADGIQLAVIVMAMRHRGTEDTGPRAPLPEGMNWLRDALSRGAL